MKLSGWRQETNGAFVMETARIRLMVRRPAGCHFTRFFVLAWHGSPAERLLGSGTSIDVGQGMREAEKMAERFFGVAAFRGLSVMVVDAISSERGTSADVLWKAGYQVTEAVNGESALHQLERTTPPEIVIADTDLGDGMSGLELSARIHKPWPAIGVLLISARDDLAACEVAKEAFLPKPYSVDQFLERVASLAVVVRSSAKSALN